MRAVDGTKAALFAWLNTNKHSITADLGIADDAAAVRALLATSDLLLDARPLSELQGPVLSHQDLRRTEPGLAITALSWFGENGPYRDYAMTESVCRSLAGLVKLVGPVEDLPVLPRDGQLGDDRRPRPRLFRASPGSMGHVDRRAPLRGEHCTRPSCTSAEFDTGLALEAGFSRPRPGLNRFGRGYPFRKLS